jgi:peroxiredoxin Q/BCP
MTITTEKMFKGMDETKKKNNTPDSNFVAHSTKLRPGQKAPDFEAKDQDGNLVRLQDFSGKTLVLYFYPKDDTPTCTAQACNLRDDYQLLREKGYVLYGVSADDEKSHAKFIRKFNLPFPLLADTEMKMIRDYDVWGTKMLFGRILDGIVRTTFIINKDGYIEHIINNVVSASHAQQILEPGS